MILELTEANETSAYLTNPDGYDVAKIERYLPKELTEEHAAHALTDEQWQGLVDLIAGYLNDAPVRPEI